MIDQRPGHPRPPVAPPPGPGVVRALYQRTSWTTAGGETLRLTAMTTAHLLAVAGYLRWYAPVLADQDPTPRGAAPLADWLVGLPLWQAIEAELRERGILAGGLLDCLRLQGTVPWEEAERGLTNLTFRAPRVPGSAVRTPARRRPVGIGEPVRPPDREIADRVADEGDVADGLSPRRRGRQRLGRRRR